MIKITMPFEETAAAASVVASVVRSSNRNSKQRHFFFFTEIRFSEQFVLVLETESVRV
jgi:hypothetical protein